MAEWYNLSAVNATGFLEMTQSVNSAFMFNQFGNLLLLAIFTISLISFGHFNNNPKINFMFSSFIIALLSIFMRILILVPDFTPFFCWALFAVSAALLTFTK